MLVVGNASAGIVAWAVIPTAPALARIARRCTVWGYRNAPMSRLPCAARRITAPVIGWGVVLLAATSPVLLAGRPAAAADPTPIQADGAALARLRISQRPCWLNRVRQSCVITALEGSEALRIDLSAGDRPFWVFTPSGAATTDRRPFRDGQGRTWLFSGHHSFQLVEQGPERNVIEVESP